MVETIGEINKYLTAQANRSDQIKKQAWKAIIKVLGLPDAQTATKTNKSSVLTVLKSHIEDTSNTLYRADKEALQVLLKWSSNAAGDGKAKTQDILKNLPSVIGALGQWFGTTPLSREIFRTFIDKRGSIFNKKLKKVLPKLQSNSLNLQEICLAAKEANIEEKLNRGQPFSKVQQAVLEKIERKLGNVSGWAATFMSLAGLSKGNPGKIPTVIFGSLQYSEQEKRAQKQEIGREIKVLGGKAQLKSNIAKLKDGIKNAEVQIDGFAEIIKMREVIEKSISSMKSIVVDGSQAVGKA